jgi:hypothetical protein
VGKTAGRSISSIHDEVVEEGKGGNLANGKCIKNLNHQKMGLNEMKIMGCPERSSVPMIEVVFLYFKFLTLGFPQLTPPT